MSRAPGEIADAIFAARLEALDQLGDDLHRFAGVCGHCGKRKCPQKNSWSTLPEKIRLVDFEDAIAAGRARVAVEKEVERRLHEEARRK